MSSVTSTSSEIFPCVSKIRGRNSSPRAVALWRYFSRFFALRSLVADRCARLLRLSGGRTRVNHRNVGLNRFVNPRVEDDVGLEFLLSVLVIQTRVLSVVTPCNRAK